MPGLPRRGWLGALLASGGRVEAVWPSSPAAELGLSLGDTLVSIAGEAIADGDAAAAVVRGRSGESVAIAWRRDGVAHEGALAVAEIPSEVVPGASVAYETIVAGGVRRRVIVTRPTAMARAPSIVLLTGSATESIDLVPPRSSPAAHLIAALAAAGYTSWRLEPQGVGDSEGERGACDLATEHEAARAVIARARADGGPTFVFGHSAGGWLAPSVADECRGVVVYGTWAEPFTAAMIDSLARQRPAAADANARDAAILRAVVERGEAPGDVLRADPSLASATALDGAGRLWGRTPAFYRQLQESDLVASWQRVRCRVLALHGDRDRITTYEQHAAIAAHAGDAEVASIAHHEHDMTGPTDAIAATTIAFVRRLA